MHSNYSVLWGADRVPILSTPSNETHRLQFSPSTYVLFDMEVEKAGPYYYNFTFFSPQRYLFLDRDDKNNSTLKLVTLSSLKLRCLILSIEKAFPILSSANSHKFIWSDLYNWLTSSPNRAGPGPGKKFSRNEEFAVRDFSTPAW